MSLVKTVVRQRDFSGGEIDESGGRRDDTKLFPASLKRALNGQPLDAGALARRPGRRVRYFDGGWHDVVRPVSDSEFDVTFADGRFTARLTGGSVVTNITGCPWTAAMLPDLSWVAAGKRIFVAHRSFMPQVLTYDVDAGSWGLVEFAFRLGLNGATDEPFYRFADFGETMQPSATTGSVTLTTLTDVFDPGHVGARFTWGGKQVLITAVTTARLATATVIEELPPSFRVTVDTVSGFIVGEVVEGQTSGAKGELIAVDTVAKTLDILCTTNFLGFTATELIIGQNGRAKVTSQALQSPFATIQWEESFISAVRGYPGSVSFDVQRLIFCDFPQFEQGILWSAIDAPDNLKITGDADGAIFEYVPRPCRVLFVEGFGDEIVFTDRGVFYIPIAEGTPLAPGSVEFRVISNDAVAKVRPVAVPNGLIFVGSTRKRLFAIVGNRYSVMMTVPHTIKPLTDFHSHLFTEVIAIAASTDASDTISPNFAYAVNADGSVAAGRYNVNEDWMGWFPWTSTGRITAVISRYGETIFSVAYDLAAGVVETVEVLDRDAVMDGTIDLVDFIGTDPFRDSTGDPILDSTGEAIFASSGFLVPFAGVSVDLIANGFYFGEIMVGADGSVDVPLAAAEFVDASLGLRFPVEVQPFIPAPDGGSNIGQALRRRKVGKSAITVRNTTVFRAGNHTFAGFLAGEDMESVRPVRDATYTWRGLGRAYDPTETIIQDVPGTFTMLEMAFQVTA